MREHGRGLDGRTVERGRHRQSSCGSGGSGGVAYEVRGYKQGWADRRAGKTGKPTAQIEPKSLAHCNHDVQTLTCTKWNYITVACVTIVVK